MPTKYCILHPVHLNISVQNNAPNICVRGYNRTNNKDIWLLPSVKEEELALSILLSMGEVSFEAIAGGIGYCAEAMRLAVVIHWTWPRRQTHTGIRKHNGESDKSVHTSLCTYNIQRFDEPQL